MFYLSEIGMKSAFCCNLSWGLSHRYVEFLAAVWSEPLVSSYALASAVMATS